MAKAITEITADEKLWDEQFAATSDEKLAALVASVETEIDAVQVLPRLDERGNFIEYK